MSQVLEQALAGRTLAERPEVRHDVAGDAATLIGDAYNDVLGALADGDLDVGRRLRVRVAALTLTFGLNGPAALVPFYDGLNRVAQELADDVLEVAEDEGEAGFEVALDLDVGDGHVRPVGLLGYAADGLAAAVDDVLGYAFGKYLAYEFGAGCFGAAGRRRQGSE